jgi:hypothetical protein
MYNSFISIMYLYDREYTGMYKRQFTGYLYKGRQVYLTLNTTDYYIRWVSKIIY